jgi:cephalosporin-C deacetylase-like acetyl esterase
MRYLSILLINLFITPCFINSGMAQMKTGPQGSEGNFYREQAYHLPLKGMAGQRVAALVFRPPQDTPRPLLILTHGTEANAEKNKEWKVGYYPHAVDFFMQQGFVVALVHRRGYGLTGGNASEGFSCERPNHLRALQGSNLDLISVIESLTRLPFVKEKGIVLAA